MDQDWSKDQSLDSDLDLNRDQGALRAGREGRGPSDPHQGDQGRDQGQEDVREAEVVQGVEVAQGMEVVQEMEVVQGMEVALEMEVALGMEVAL